MGVNQGSISKTTNAASIAERDPTSRETQCSDPVYRAVMALCEPGVLESQVQRVWSQLSPASLSVLGVTILQKHYKPWTRARLLVEVVAERDGACGDPVTQLLFLQVYSSETKARRRLAASSMEEPLPSIGPAVFAIADWNAVAWALPNGPKLEGAQVCFAASPFIEFLDGLGLDAGAQDDPIGLPQFIRYVPRKRALFRCMPRDQASTALYIKFYGRGADVAAARNLALITKVAEQRFLAFRPPRLVAHDPRSGAVVMEEVPGVQLTELLANPPAAVFAAVGRALAGLHGSGLTTSHTWTPERELSALGNALSDIVEALPALASELRVLLERFKRQQGSLLPGQQTPIHANLFGDQILIESNSGSNSGSNGVAIVDWDDLAMGDPLYDVGRLIAHLIFAARQMGNDPAGTAQSINSMLNRYVRETGRPLANDRLRWHVAMALLMRAKISALRSLPPTWVEDIKESVAEATRILDEQGTWRPSC